jgi:hypothetical protein
MELTLPTGGPAGAPVQSDNLAFINKDLEEIAFFGGAISPAVLNDTERQGCFGLRAAIRQVTLTEAVNSTVAGGTICIA